jgi:hypothetical protein
MHIPLSPLFVYTFFFFVHWLCRRKASEVHLTGTHTSEVHLTVTHTSEVYLTVTRLTTITLTRWCVCLVCYRGTMCAVCCVSCVSCVSASWYVHEREWEDTFFLVALVHVDITHLRVISSVFETCWLLPVHHIFTKRKRKKREIVWTLGAPHPQHQK